MNTVNADKGSTAGLTVFLLALLLTFVAVAVLLVHTLGSGSDNVKQMPVHISAH